METKITPHWFTRGILGIFSFLFTLMGTVGVYLLIYKDTINTLLIGSESDLIMKVIIILLTVFIIGTIILLLFYKWRISVGIKKSIGKGVTEFRRGSYFSLFLISNIIGFGGIAGAYVVSDTSIKDLPIDESIFVRSDFDYENPTYTDKKICDDYESYINTLPFGSYIAKDELKRKIYEALETLAISPENADYSYMPSYTKDKQKNAQEILSQYKDTPEYNNVIDILAKDYIISDTQYEKLKVKISELPKKLICTKRNDENLEEELIPRLISERKTIGILSAKANFLALQGRIDEAIIVVNSLYDYSEKLRGSNLTLVSEMYQVAQYNTMYSVIENIWSKANNEQKEKLKELVQADLDFEEDFKNAARGEYYFFNHTLTGRAKSLKDINIPFLFDGEDTVNRGIILVYRHFLLEKQDADKLFETYKTHFSTPMEASLIGSDEGMGNNPLSYMHNFLGKRYVYQMSPGFSGYVKKIEQTSKYYEYLQTMMK